jgi:glycosyltransferase involved in cell wall biosynthesis
VSAPAEVLSGARARAGAGAERVRVAAVMDTSIVSGPGRQLAALAAPLREAGVDLRVIVFQHTGREHSDYRRFLERAGVDHVVVPFARTLDRTLLPKLRAAIDAFAPHVVQTHSYRPTTLVWLLRRAGVPWKWLGFFHGTTNEDLKVRVYHWLDRKLLPSADRIVVMSRLQLAHFADCGDRALQIYNAVIPVPPVAPTDATRATLAAVEAIPRPRVGVVGRLSAEKGVDVMLHALKRLADGGTAASLVIAGDGPDRAMLEALAASLGVADRAHFLGPVLPIEPLYPTLDLLVIPSRSEGLPNVLLEALRADVPVVSTRVGAVPEVLDGTGAGWVVPPEDPAALSAAIAEALREPVEHGRDARAGVVRRFSLDQRVQAHVTLYRDVLAGVAR